MLFFCNAVGKEKLFMNRIVTVVVSAFLLIVVQQRRHMGGQ